MLIHNISKIVGLFKTKRYKTLLNVAVCLVAEDIICDDKDREYLEK